MSNFIEKCLNGDALVNEIDSYIEIWHKDESIKQELHEFLGMNFFEYQLWVEKPESLKYILNAKKKGLNVKEYMEKNINSIAARAQDYKAVLNWLRATGRISL